jgi:glycosyltransferase involved in cell wall biosynthesis
MKILHIAPISFKQAFGGPSNSVLNLAKGQVKLGHSIALLSSKSGEVIENNTIDGVLLLASPIKKHINPWKISKNWVSLIKKHFGIPDIVNFHDTYDPFHVALSKHFISEGWPYVFTPRGGLSVLAQKVKFYKKIPANLLFFNKYVKKSALIHALCENEAEEIRIKYPNSNIFIVSNGVSDDLLSISDEAYKKDVINNLKEKSLITIGFIGRIDVYHKGLDLLFLAIKKLQESWADNKIKLIITGPFYSNKDRQKIFKMIEKMPYKDDIFIKPPVFNDEKWAEINTYDIFVHTSRFEGLPNSVLEAMTLGKPCLVTQGTNMCEIMKLNKCGWGCDTSVESIKNTIELAISDFGIIDQYGKNAKLYILKNNTMNSISKKCIEAYQSVT